jgi:hypothetical protein
MRIDADLQHLSIILACSGMSTFRDVDMHLVDFQDSRVPLCNPSRAQRFGSEIGVCEDFCFGLFRICFCT